MAIIRRVMGYAVSGCFILAVAVMAAKTRAVHYELYSWQNGRDWCFSVFKGTDTVRDLEAVKARESVLKGAYSLKGRLAVLQPETMVHWRQHARDGLRLPPDEIVQDIQRYMEGLQVNLTLPQDAVNSKSGAKAR